MPDYLGPSPTASVSIPVGATLTVIDTRIAASADDVEERASGRMMMTSTDLELLQDKTLHQTVGLRFTDLNIPAGAVIVRAYIQFSADEVGAEETHIEIRGLASDDLAPFTQTRFDLTTRALTNGLATWSPAAWMHVNEVGVDQRTPDLAAIVQEIVGRSGWETGNDLGFSLSGSGHRTADAVDGNPQKGAVLHVEYYIPQVGSADIVFRPDPNFRENVAGAVLGTIGLAPDAPAGNYVFTTNDDRFQLVGTTLRLRDDLRLDFERDPAVSVLVNATDGAGHVYSETITAAVGDVAETRFAAFGDYGAGAGADNVARMIDALNVDFIITVGDNSYGSDPIDDQVGVNYSDYIGHYTGAYGAGSSTDRFFPALGNHEYDGAGGGVPAYLDYFTLPGNERYYDFVIGPVHFFAVNSNPEEPDGRSETSVQAHWLQAGLAASTSLYNIVYFHHSPYSSGVDHGSIEVMQWPFEEWGATAVITGHDHGFERVLRDDDHDGQDLAYLVSGLGGHSRYGFGTPVEGSMVRYSADYGSLLIQASAESITFEFLAAEGPATGTIIDSYTIDLPSMAMNAMIGETKPLPADDPFLAAAVIDASAPIQMHAFAPADMDLFI